MTQPTIREFDQWRDVTRELLASGLPPDAVDLIDGWQEQGQLLFAECSDAMANGSAGQPRARGRAFSVPKKFLQLARCVACHRHPSRWNVLYRVLWRLTHGAPRLLEMFTDEDVFLLRSWHQQVRHDAHRMKAFVRFRRCEVEGCEWFVAWHRPDYRVAQLVASFFVDRFAAMCWSILTPDEGMVWDRRALHWGPGTGRAAEQPDDNVEPLWVRYYGAMFNPDRVNLRVMRAQMPERYWATLPETTIIDELVTSPDDAKPTPRIHPTGIRAEHRSDPTSRG
ncbi:MAG: TIGR03915 family putative DNA repair protein [Pirellulaceae bacterium]